MQTELEAERVTAGELRQEIEAIDFKLSSIIPKCRQDGLLV